MGGGGEVNQATSPDTALSQIFSLELYQPNSYIDENVQLGLCLLSWNDSSSSMHL